MFGIVKEDVVTMILAIAVILLTHAVFFMAYSYLMSGDPLLGLKNFYSIMYNIR